MEILTGEELADLSRPGRYGRILGLAGRKVAVAWSTGRTTKILRRLISPTSRHYQIVSARQAPPPAKTAVPTSAGACRDGGGWICAVCRRRSAGPLLRPWRELVWTVGRWKGSATIVCSDACSERVRRAGDANT